MGIENPITYIEFEKPVQGAHTQFIDAYIPSTRTIIEQKRPDVNLDDAFTQAKRYYDCLPFYEKGRWIVTCDFRQFRVHDMNKPSEQPDVIPLSEITPAKLSFLIEPERELDREVKISKAAGGLVRKLYDTLRARYVDPDSKSSQASLNVFCVRLVFLLYAEDAGLFKKNQFHDYLKPRSIMAADALKKLFRVLNQKPHERDPYLEQDLQDFAYVNGGLFETKDLELPPP